VKIDLLSARINKLLRWARDYIHNIETFIGAEDVHDLTFLRDQNKALIKLVGELNHEIAGLKRRLAARAANTARDLRRSG
jgi:hypothetical protein